jgi:penicillin V acylase-like amidase (Ntn superfamily)
MKKIGAIFLSFLVLLSLLSVETLACTTFCLKNKGEVLFGKNYDWMIADGLVFVNKRGVAKTALTEGGETPARWTSRYGSVTFNQYGRDNPMGGMNEAGLVIELMWLDETRYPKADARPKLDVLEWIQYNLDISATVQDVLKNTENVRIDSDVTLHYLVNDKNGNSATIEFLDGRLVAHTGENLAVSALANDTYEKSLNYSKTILAEKAHTESSLDRFTRAAQKTKEFEKQPRGEQEAVNYAFDILANVAQKDSTQWSIVYDQMRGKIYFRTRPRQQIKSVNLKSFDYSCGGAVKILDINSMTAGDVTAKFTDYSTKANRDLIERSFNGTPFLRGVPAPARDAMAQFPESFPCEETQAQSKPTTITAQVNNQNSGVTGGFLFSAIYYLAKVVGIV